ncbi:MAG: DMT family transporter [Rhodobacteraceae bacterium]|nr:DMT family transporter [Paracoccaceae bacterium]
MELWIPITIAAAFLQNLRSVLQKHLKSRLSTAGATVSRFIFAVPVALTVLAMLKFGLGYDIPTPNAGFLTYGMVGAIMQITATFLLVYLFGLRNFAVGTTFSKTEAVQTAVVGYLVLSEKISTYAIVGILVSLVGVVVISSPGGLRKGLFSRSAGIGIASGAAFGISAVSYRAASLSLDTGDFLIRGATLLAFTTVFQTVLMLIYLALRERGQTRAVLINWRIGALVGLTGGMASLGWFTAMTLQNAAYVRALAQVELLFTLVASWLIFKEKTSARELAGMGLILGGILVLVLLR